MPKVVSLPTASTSLVTPRALTEVRDAFAATVGAEEREAVIDKLAYVLFQAERQQRQIVPATRTLDELRTVALELLTPPPPTATPPPQS